MNYDVIYAVNKDGEIGKEYAGNDIVFYAIKKQISRPCASYAYDDYEIVDECGNRMRISTGRYNVERIWTSGYAENYCLNVKVTNDEGEEYSACFSSDIRFNLPFELFIIPVEEWDISNPFSVIVPFLSEIEKFGVDAYKEINKLRKEIQGISRKHKYSNYKLERYGHIGRHSEELVFKEGMKEILEREFYECQFNNIKRIVLPSTLETIGDFAFTGLTSIESIICKAEIPPTVGLAFYRSGTKKLFVPAGSVEAYMSSWNPRWNNLEILPLE